MLKGLEYVKETIEFRGNDIAGNEFETNNLLMDDILMALGYNKRREQGVKAVYSGESDWEVNCEDTNRFTLAVYGYGSERPTVEQLSTAFAYAANGDYTFVIVTDGMKMDIYSDGELAVQIEDIFSTEAEPILNSISKQGWAPEEIAKAVKSINITREELVEALYKDIDNIVNTALVTLKLADTDENRDAVKCTLELILNSDNSLEIIIEGMTQEKAVLKDEIAKMMKEILELKEASTSNSSNVSIEEIESLNSKISEQMEEIEKLKEEKANTEHNSNIDLGKDSSSDETAKLSQSDETAYRNKITTLTEENQALRTEINNYKDTLEEIERKQANREDEKVTMARQLLDAVEDNKELNRAYVGVVNARLFQIGELNKFVGTCIQELYSTVSFELMHLLFDGDIFKITQPAIRGDLLINAKTYDIDTSMLNEDEILSRLKSLFGKFEKVVFMCKTIGTLKIEETINIEAEIELDNQIVFDEEADPFINSSQADFDTTGENFEATEDCFEAGEDELDTSEIEFDAGNDCFEEPEIIMQEAVLGQKILKLPLSDIGMVLWSEVNPITKPLAVGNDYRTFRLTDNNIFDSAVVSIINMSDNVLTAIETLKNTDLTSVSANIHLGVEGESDVEIAQTNYFTDTSDVKKYISVLLTLAEVIGIDSYTTYMYFEVNDDISYELETSCISEDALNNLLEINVDITECSDTIHCILSGSALEKVIDVSGINDVARELISNTVAIRTSYMTQSLKSVADIAKSFETCMTNVPIDEMDNILNRVNTLSENKLILTKDDTLSEEAVEFTVIGDKTYFIDAPNKSDVVLALFIIHKSTVKDNAIDIRVELNSTVYTYFQTAVSTSDCYKYFARSVMCKVMEGKTKVIAK